MKAELTAAPLLLFSKISGDERIDERIGRLVVRDDVVGGPGGNEVEGMGVAATPPERSCTPRFEGHKATDTELTYAPVSQAYGHRRKLQFNV